MLRIAVLAVALLASAPALAGLQVTPVLVEFVGAEAARVIRVSNSGSVPLRAQVRLLAWTQGDAGDTLQPVPDVLASPPIMELAPGQEQLVRVIRTQAAAPARELAYRMLVDELPGGEGKQGVQLLLRHAIPVFVLPPGTVRAGERRGKTDLSSLTGQVQPVGAGIRLSLRNDGAQRVRLSQVRYHAADGQQVALSDGLLGYVLAGQQMQWTLALPPERVGPGGTFNARVNNDVEPQTLPVALPAR